MKSLIFTTLLALSFSSFAQTCKKVANSCLTEVKLTGVAAELVNIETNIINNNEQVNHIHKLIVLKGDLLHNFNPAQATQESIKALSVFATKRLGSYDRPQYTPFEVLQSAKTLTKAKLASELGREFINSTEEDVSELDLAPAEAKAFARHKQIRAQGIKALADLIVGNAKSVVVYELLDNNNENVANTEIVIVSDTHVVLIDRQWWL